VHQVNPKDSGSKNFSFLALKGKTKGVVQILRTATATARDKRIIFSAQTILYIHKKFKKYKISEKNSFIPYEASIT
jgi:hypothetical protein